MYHSIPSCVVLITFLSRSSHSFLLLSRTFINRYSVLTSKQCDPSICELGLDTYSQTRKRGRNGISKLYQETDSTTDSSTDSTTDSSQILDGLQTLSRRDAALLFVGGTAYAKLAFTVFKKVQRGEDVYPPEHENRAADTFSLAFKRSASKLMEQTNDLLLLSSSSTSLPRPLRVLEVGVGSSCRTFTRGIYDTAIRQVYEMTKGQRQQIVNGIDFIGADIDIPKSEDIVQNARDHITKNINDSSSFPTTLNVLNADITEGLPFPDGYFDVITTSLVLCSVQDQNQALDEIRRLLNPNSGSFGYIEHVAVNVDNEEEKDLGFLALQQQILDPLQQALVHNCHLRRNTDSVIYDILVSDSSTGGNRKAQLLQSERFQVKDMWPVSCQCRGVVQFSYT